MTLGVLAEFLLEWFLNKDPFFKGKDNNEQLIKIIKILGFENFKAYCDKYNVELKSKMIKKIESYSGVKWEHYEEELPNIHQYKDAFNLLEKLLNYDHNERILPKDALKHKFFTDVSDDMDIDSSEEEGD